MDGGAGRDALQWDRAIEFAIGGQWRGTTAATGSSRCVSAAHDLFATEFKSCQLELELHKFPHKGGLSELQALAHDDIGRCNGQCEKI